VRTIGRCCGYTGATLSPSLGTRSSSAHHGVINHIRDEPFASEKEVASASAENMVDICRHTRHTTTHVLDVCIRKAAIVGAPVPLLCRVHGHDVLHSSQRSPSTCWCDHTGAITLAAMVNRLTARTRIGNFVMAITCSTPAPLILKRGKLSRSSGTWKNEDYDALADGKVVGRVLEEGSRFGPPELRWGGRSPSSCRRRRA
jgi:hypothetical protein